MKFLELGFPRANPSYWARRHLAAKRETITLPFRIPQDWIDSVVYFFPDAARSEASEEAGGTGFLLGWPFDDGKDFTLWIVTNYHVIEQGHWTVRLNQKSGGFEHVDTDDRQWIALPDKDLAVRPVALSQDIHKFSFLTKEWILDRHWFEALDIGPGDECISIGRFYGHSGKKSNNPVSRFGQIAQNPTEPITIDGRNYECFLIESRSINGYSGSPVFCHLDSQYYRPSINLKQAPDGSTLGQGRFPTGPWLLGVNFALVPIWQEVCDASGKTLGTHKVPQNAGLMGVIPAWNILDFFENGIAGDVRREMEKQIRAEQVTLASLPSALLSDQGSV